MELLEVGVAVGQKTHPIGFRVPYIKPWAARWYAKKEYGKWLTEDQKVRELVKKRLAEAGVSSIETERMLGKLKVSVQVARPGIAIGKGGERIEELKREIAKIVGCDVTTYIHEVRKPELDAQLISETVAQQLERRVSFRRATKRAVQQAMKLGAQGIKIRCAGRLGGAEMSRVLWYREGRVPLQTLRADIDYGFSIARCPYGVIGVKVWVYKGDVIK